MGARNFAAALLLAGAAGSAFAWQSGDRVLAQWGDGMWYPARVNRVEGDRVQVNYDDGDVSTISQGQLRRIDWRVGTRVNCNWKNKGKYYWGVIGSLDGEIAQINYDDGDREVVSIGRCRVAG